jgi:glycogen debranching enzyme
VTHEASDTPQAAAGAAPPGNAARRVRPGALMHEGEWYVNASSMTAGIRKLVLKDNDAFLVTDRRGDLPEAQTSELGYYLNSTRHLSLFEVRMQGELPLVLDAGPSSDDRQLEIDLTNATSWELGDRRLPSHSIFMRREVRLELDVLHHVLRLHNFDLQPVHVDLWLRFASDFADMFEVRGTPRKARGVALPAQVGRSRVRLSYRGLDSIVRETEISIEPPADDATDRDFFFDLHLPPGADRQIHVRVEASDDGRAASAVRADPRPARALVKSPPFVRASDASFNRILDRAIKDLVTMLTLTPHGLYPSAGIPWFCAPFGRDGAITALELLPWMPSVARGVLRYQAHYQAHDFDDFTDREPGKIFHELREGEMANLREIPFVPYYGSADSTPLFLILLYEYVRTTGDLELLAQLWPNALRALTWIERHGDLDGDGFVEYQRRSRIGLANQAWKDSFDSISHADGSLAEPPIAVCEVQGYVHRAWVGCAALAEMRGDSKLAIRLRARADALLRDLHAAYWLEPEGFFALALDRHKRPCRVLTTNAGHLLWAGAALPEIGARMAHRLTGPELTTGFGLRTLAHDAARYNPISYHNGSVWPHDNAIVAEGLRRYGHLGGMFDVLTGVVDAVSSLHDARVPELYCGFQRPAEQRVTAYPVACAPQAWSSGAILAFVRTLLGLSVDGALDSVRFDDPVLPPWLDWLEVRNLPVRGGSMDFVAIRGRVSCSVEILAKSAGIHVLMTKS